MKAIDIVQSVARSVLPPDAPLPFVEVKGARFHGKDNITANVIMFDGLPAVMHLSRWSLGWSYGWDSMPGGDISLEGGAWERVDPPCARASIPFGGGAINWGP